MSELVGIYGFKNTLDSKWYIGQSIDVATRKTAHFTKLKSQKHHNCYFQRAYNKYGEEAFEFHILEECPENMLDIRECHWIAYYKSNNKLFGYNSEGGGNKNKQCSKETRERMSLAKKGIKFTEEHRKKMSLARKGIKFSEEHKRKIGLASLGRTHSPEIKTKLRIANLGKTISEETRQKMSEASKNKWKDPIYRNKISSAQKGNKYALKNKFLDLNKEKELSNV